MITMDFSGTGGFSARVELHQQPDVDRNCSVLEAKLYIISTRWLGVTYWLQGQVTGRSFSSSYDNVYADKIGEPALAGQPWSFQVEHDPEGNGSVTVTVKLSGYTADGGYGNGWRIEGSKTAILEPIALSSQVALTEGEVTTIAINRKNSGYTHVIECAFGDLHGYIDDNGILNETPVVCRETVIRFPVPEAFYRQIPNAQTGEGTLTCITLNGDRQVGSAAVTALRITVPQQYKPHITHCLRDCNPETVALTGNEAVAVRFMSHIFCEAGAEGFLGATIVELTANGAAVPATLAYTDKVLLRAVDSRGYVTEQVKTMETVPYVLLTVNGSCNRTAATGATVEVTLRGSCYGGSFGIADNHLTITITAGGKTYTATPEIREDRYEGNFQLEELGYEQSHVITVTARDALMEVTTELLLSRGVPVFDWGRRDFAFHVPVTAPSVNGIKNPALKAWPVGALLIVPNDPTAAIGGKWEHTTLLGVDAWRRVQGADLLGAAALGALVLGTEE